MTDAFLDCLFEDLAPAWIEIRLIEERKPAPPPLRFWFPNVADLSFALPCIQADAERDGMAVYFGVLPRCGNGAGTSAETTPGWVAWVDCDFKDVEEGETRRRIAHLEHPPSIVVHSGRGLHLYWLQKEATDPAILSALSCRLAAALGGDHCYDAARILRLPGTRNLKHCWSKGGTYTPSPDGPVCTIESFNPALRYSPDDFDDLPEATTTTIEAPQRPRATKDIGQVVSARVSHLLSTRPRIAALHRGEGKTTGDQSGSGYDFSYAIALAWAGVENVDELDAAVAARPNHGKARTKRAIRRCSDRALAIVESRLPAPPASDAPMPPDAPLSDGVLDTLARAAVVVQAGDRDATDRLVIELSNGFIQRAANHPDPDAVTLALRQLLRPGFRTDANRIIRAIDKERKKGAEQQDQATRRIAAEEARQAAAERATVEDWPIERRGPHPGVLDSLAFGKTGPKPCFSNLYKVLRDDPRWGKRLRFNHLGYVVEVDGKPIESEPVLTANVVEWVGDTYEMQFMPDVARAAVYSVAGLNSYHPVRDYLSSLPMWAGASTISRLLPEVLGVPATTPHFDLYQKFMRRTMIAAVARAMRPGCKVDTALIFVGEQGGKKSTFFKFLFSPAFFGDSPIPIGDKNAAIQLAATWGYECAEMESLSRKTAEEVKQWLSQADDLFRHIFERNARRWPRHSVIVGTTNKMEFLVDSTGSRRFWPIPIPDDHVIDIALLKKLRDAVWTEALDAWMQAELIIHAGETPPEHLRWWFERDEDRERAVSAKQFEVGDVWDAIVNKWATECGYSFTIADILENALDMDKARMTDIDKRRVGAILRRHGWTDKRTKVAGVVRVLWVKPATETAPAPRLPFVPHDDLGVPH